MTGDMVIGPGGKKRTRLRIGFEGTQSSAAP